jgi:hypothetical protein
MNTCTRILSASIVAWLCLVAWGFAQVEPEGDLNLLPSNDLLLPPGSYHGDEIVFRNRMGAMCFTATADMVAMQRVDNNSFTLLTNGQGGPEAFNVGDLHFPMRTGPKLNLIVHEILFGGDLELGFMRIDGFSVSKTRYSGADSLYFASPFLTAEATGGQGIRFDYQSRLTSGEASLRYDFGDRLSLLGGFRYIELHEQFDGNIVTAGLTDSHFIGANTDNHLYGFQLGAELMAIKFNKIMVVGIAKAGIFSNQADLTMYGADENSAVGGVKGQLAFVGEASLVGSYLLSDNIAVRLGYQAMWIQGVALGSDQMNISSDLAPPAWHPNTNGSLFYHGAFLGVELSF